MTNQLTDLPSDRDIGMPLGMSLGMSFCVNSSTIRGSFYVVKHFGLGRGVSSLSVGLCVCLCVCQYVCVSVGLCTCLSVCLSVCLWDFWRVYDLVKSL